MFSTIKTEAYNIYDLSLAVSLLLEQFKLLLEQVELFPYIGFFTGNAILLLTVFPWNLSLPLSPFVRSVLWYYSLGTHWIAAPQPRLSKSCIDALDEAPLAAEVETGQSRNPPQKKPLKVSLKWIKLFTFANVYLNEYSQRMNVHCKGMLCAPHTVEIIFKLKRLAIMQLCR